MQQPPGAAVVDEREILHSVDTLQTQHSSVLPPAAWQAHHPCQPLSTPRPANTHLRAVASCRSVARDASQSPWRTQPSISVMQLPPSTSAGGSEGWLRSTYISHGAQQKVHMVILQCIRLHSTRCLLAVDTHLGPHLTAAASARCSGSPQTQHCPPEPAGAALLLGRQGETLTSQTRV